MQRHSLRANNSRLSHDRLLDRQLGLSYACFCWTRLKPPNCKISFLQHDLTGNVGSLIDR